MEKPTKYKTYGKRRSLRLQEFDYSRPFIYHAIVGTKGREAIFETLEAVRIAINCLIDQASALNYEVFAFCFMPDHLHLLCQPGEGAPSLDVFIGRFKSLSTRSLAQAGFGWKIWQRGFYDHILRKEEDLWALARYIADNPVRKGLVEDYKEYPFSFIRGIKSCPIASLDL
ncbi:MAG TPA: transposase [Anaerolineae bacterium]|nr:transposase [Anaerolineae bacterium]